MAQLTPEVNGATAVVLEMIGGRLRNEQGVGGMCAIFN